MKKADWVKYCRDIVEVMLWKREEVGKTVSEWEYYINQNIACQAKKSVGVQKIKIGKTILKGWRMKR